MTIKSIEGIKMNRIKVGEVFTTSEGCECVVVEYVNYSKVRVKFLDEFGYEYFVAASSLRVGKVKNPYHPSVYGVGYLGVGEHKSRVEGKLTKEYDTWRGMLQRCYYSKAQERRPTYKGCYVIKDWHNFQEFAVWYNNQYKEDGWQLDKDILKSGNKEYSKEWCRMIPQEVNSLLLDRGSLRGGLPVGVCVHRGFFQAQLAIFGKNKHLGTYTTPTEAFLVYRKAKELQIKVVANLYKDTICKDVYSSLMSWSVECPIYDKLVDSSLVKN